jgi:hypothetical protein
MGKTSYGGQGSRSCGQAIARGREGARQTGGPQHQANPVHRLNTGCPKSDNDRRPSDNDRRPNNKDRRQYSDGRNSVHARIDTVTQNVADSTRKPRSQRVDAERRQVVDSTRKSVHQRLGPVPPQRLILKRKRKPTPSIALTSNATLTKDNHQSKL